MIKIYCKVKFVFVLKFLHELELIGGLVERGDSQIASSVFLKHVFITIEIRFWSGKYSHLIDLFFHVVYFLLENDIL